MYKLFHGAILVLAGVGGYVLYKTYWQDANPTSTGTDDYWAGLNLGHTGWVPQLPIHPKSMQPTQAIYQSIKVSPRRGRPGQLTPMRTMDYYNPAQLVPSIGPENLTPKPDTKFVTAAPINRTAMWNDPGSLTGGGPLPTIAGSGAAFTGRVLA